MAQIIREFYCFTRPKIITRLIAYCVQPGSTKVHCLQVRVIPIKVSIEGMHGRRSEIKLYQHDPTQQGHYTSINSKYGILNVIIVNEKFAVRITDIISPDNRFEAL